MRTVSLSGPWSFARLPGYSLDHLPAESFAPAFETVTVPHTWYRDEDQYRGLTVYEKTIRRDPEWERALLSFDGADQRCQVTVNGYSAGSHNGGYSRFRLPVPPETFSAETWTIRVYLDNSIDEDVIPSFGDFTVFGGLCRSVSLIITGAAAFDRCFWGTDGLIVRASLDGAGQGICSLEPHVTGETQDAFIRYTLSLGEDICTLEASPFETAQMTVPHPQKWNGIGQTPLYTLQAELVLRGSVVDEVTVRTGFRQVTLTPDRGLVLNGRPLPLHGVARHQDRAGTFNVSSEQEIRQDFDFILGMGANAVRLSHYQHPQSAYDCCDETGLMCWAEVPMLKMTESKALMENTQQQLTELILQNIHHPAIFCWGIQNEIAMFRDAPFMHENCRQLHDLVRSLDPGRFSAAANLYPLKASSRLNTLTDIVGYNVYFGWYYGEMTDYGPWLDQMHLSLPALPLGISEYGVDANTALHAEEPKLKDYSEEYQALWHESVWPQIESRPFLWGSFVWNMFDFSSARRNEGGLKFINGKGLVTHDRAVCKDAYYYYKARWTTNPFIHLCAKRFEKRARESITVKCYTNQPTASLTINGRPFGEASMKNGTVVFEGVPLKAGSNEVTVTAGPVFDQAVWQRVDTPEPSYALPSTGEGPVRNWFLQDDDIRREGYFSLYDTANDLLENPESKAVLDRFIPGLVKVMTTKSVIPLGLTLKSILEHDPDEALDVTALNKALNQVRNA